MKIEILGPGCSRCVSLAANAEAAAKSLGISYELSKVTQISDIMKRGVMMTPALAINGELKSAGRVLSESEVMTLLADAMS